MSAGACVCLWGFQTVCRTAVCEQVSRQAVWPWGTKRAGAADTET